MAPTSTALIVGRAVAGLGSAGIFTGALVSIAHVTALEKRPLYFSLIGGVYGLASVIGPLVSLSMPLHDTGMSPLIQFTARWCLHRQSNLALVLLHQLAAGWCCSRGSAVLPSNETATRNPEILETGILELGSFRDNSLCPFHRLPAPLTSMGRQHLRLVRWSHHRSVCGLCLDPNHFLLPPMALEGERDSADFYRWSADDRLCIAV